MPADPALLATVSAKGGAEYILVNGIPIAPPDLGKDETVLLDSATCKALEGVTKFKVRQRCDMLETATMGCYEAPNVYEISDAASGKLLLTAVERSGHCVRIAYAPWHTMSVEFKGGGDLGGLRTVNALNEKPTVMTMEREGCCKKPCLTCYTCHPSCADGMVLHAGQMQGEPGSVGMAGPGVLGYAAVPSPLGGTFTPTLNVMDRGPGNQFRPVAKVEGPTFFGGCSEMCVDSTFLLSKTGPEGVAGGPAIKSGDLGTIVKKAPKTFQEALREAFTDSDGFEVELSPSFTPQQKALMLASMVLIDYMFFELDNGMVGCRGTKIQFTCCQCYCFCALYPCTFSLNTRQNLGFLKNVIVKG